MVYLSDTIVGASIPVKVPTGVKICGITFDDCITEDWNVTHVDDESEDSGFVWVVFANSYGYTIPPDTAR